MKVLVAGHPAFPANSMKLFERMPAHPVQERSKKEMEEAASSHSYERERASLEKCFKD